MGCLSEQGALYAQKVHIKGLMKDDFFWIDLFDLIVCEIILVLFLLKRRNFQVRTQKISPREMKKAAIAPIRSIGANTATRPIRIKKRPGIKRYPVR